ncbi:type I polyketide synthase [Nocardia sp. NPDC055053]
MVRGLCPPPGGGVAVVGLGARFPGADSVSEFWNLLVTGGDAVTDVPADRFDIDAVYHPEAGTPGRTVSRFGGFVSSGFGFDASFFGIAPVEARAVDPQQRLLLEVAWEALESAGIAPSSLAGRRVAVYVGIATSEYAEAGAEPVGIRDATGARLRAAAAGRLSYALDLRGPSVTVDTACSSSLVAVHLARQSLLAGECDLAIAAGANFINTPTDAVVYSQAGMLSTSGRCRFGDADADGFVRSEGVGVAVLERVVDARAAGDPVLAVLRSSVVNNDGRGSGLLLHPAVEGQVAMIRQACVDACITPADFDYVEAHGTGTSVGDGVELRALAEVFADRGSGPPLPVGSVKTNIGHTEAAAGIAGFIKAVLVAGHRTVPASLHCTTANPVLDGVPVEVVTDRRPLRPLREVPVVGVSSFGITGTNAHVVLEGPPSPPTNDRTELTGRPVVLVLSARSRGALSRLILRYAAYLEGPGLSRRLDTICAAAARRRDHHRYRAWVIGTDHADLARTLTDLAGEIPTRRGGFGQASDRRPKIVFLCSGQGPLWPGAAGDLLTTEPEFAAAIDCCDQAFREQFGWSVRDHLTVEQPSTATERVQPAVWTVQVALAALLRSWGVHPDYCIGHSMGEVAAATVAGALSPEDAARVIGVRSTLLGTIAGEGGMLVVGVGAEDAADLVAACASRVDIAACNAPTSTVLAGSPEEITFLAASLDRVGIFTRPVEVEVASHSRQTDVLLAELKHRLRELRPATATIALRSTVTAEPVNGTELRASYWAENLRKPVLLRETIQRLLDDEEDCVFVELGPHPLLVSAVRETQKEKGAVPAAVATLVRDQNTRLAMAATLGRLFAVGAQVDWASHFADCEPVTDLPTYAWDHEIFRRTTRMPFIRRAHVVETAIPPDATTAIVAGTRPIPPVVYARPLTELAEAMPAVHRQLIAAGAMLEQTERDVQDIEFTVDAGQLWLLQARAATRSAEARIRHAVRLAEEGVIEPVEALDRVTDADIGTFLRPRLDPAAARTATVLARGLPAGPGIGVGTVSAEEPSSDDTATAFVLARPTTAPEDVPVMARAAAVVTDHGGVTSHAAVVCRDLGVPCVVGCGSAASTGLLGRTVTVDGYEGRIYDGIVAVATPGIPDDPDLVTLSRWAAQADNTDARAQLRPPPRRPLSAPR